MKPEILYYNNHVVCDLIRKKSKMVEQFISEDYTNDLFNSYEMYGLNKHNVVYDRTDSIHHYLRMAKGLHPMPNKVENYNKSFFEITEKKCKELLSLNKPIYVMWSGGIDSTYILFALRHFANDKDQVRVYGTYNSIIESGDLFDRRIKDNFIHHIGVTRQNHLNYELDGIYVSGMCGNQLFGPTDDMFATGGKAMFHHTLGTPETIYDGLDTIDGGLLEFLDPIIRNSPKPIETIADLRWYCIFNLDWYTAIYEFKTLVSNQKFDRIYGFFDSYEFQEWAINTKEPFTKIKGNSNTHRWQMRQVLDELFDEPHYAWNKSKKISTFILHEPKWLFLLKGNHNVVF